MMRDVSRIRFAPLFVGLALLAGCGDDGPDRVESAREDAVEVIEGQDPEVNCVTGVTRRYVEDTYGDAAACKRVYEEADDSERAPTVEDVAVRGSDARVSVRLPDGEPATVFMRGDASGEEWRVDRVGADWLRAGLIATVEDIEGGILTYRPLNDCYRKRVEEMPVDELRAYAGPGGDEEKVRDTSFRLLGECPDELGAAVARQLVDQLVEKGAVAEKRKDCTIRMLEFMLPLTEAGDEPGLAMALIGAGDEESVAFVTASVLGAAENVCTEDPDARLSPAVREALRQTVD